MLKCAQQTDCAKKLSCGVALPSDNIVVEKVFPFYQNISRIVKKKLRWICDLGRRCLEERAVKVESARRFLLF